MNTIAKFQGFCGISSCYVQSLEGGLTYCLCVQVLGALFDSVLHHMDTFTLSLEIPEETVATALDFWKSQVRELIIYL